MKIFGWMADHAGCGWYRIMLPLGALQGSGTAQVRFSGRTEARDLEADVFIAQRTYRSGPSNLWQGYARKPNRPLLVYELDDDLLNIDSGNPAAEIFNHPEVRRNIRSNIEVADLVTVSTAPLAEQISKINPRVVVLPNCIPEEMLHWRRGDWTDRFTVGWQGSPTHDKDWSVAVQAIQAWFRREGRKDGVVVEMHTIGALPSNFPQLLRHRHTPWSPDLPRYYLSIDWDVALAPLKDTLFNRSKSDIRYLEAAMLGIPTVASKVPAYSTLSHQIAGFSVSRPAEWRDALTALLASPTLRDAMGDNARAYAKTRTIEANAHLWLQAYQTAITGNPPKELDA
jgi:glycosyltransferase involved in cell wall biosynthesis